MGKANNGYRPQPNADKLASRIQYFMRMNPPTIHGPKVDKDPQGLIDEVFKVVHVMGVTPREKAELVAYQLKEMAQLLYEKWRGKIPLERGPDDKEEFKESSII